MIRLITVIILFLFASCGTQKKEAERLALQPDWVKTTPNINGYYVGISSAKKLGISTQYIKKAKQQALANMAESISSYVSSQSVLQSIENKYGHSEYYNQKIEINSDEYISGFEIEDTYEDIREYWVYYKISYSKYLEMKKIQKEKALKSALQKYKEAINFKSNNKIVESINFLLQGLKILKPYLKEENIIDIEGRNIDIANKIHSTAIQTLKQFSIVCNKSSITVKNNHYIPKDLQFVTRHNNIPIANIPVIVKHSGSYLKNESRYSKQDGIINIISEKISSYGKKEKLSAEIDVKKIIQSVCDDIYIRGLMPQKEKIKCSIPVYITKESINLEIKQSSNSSIEKKHIQSIFKQEAIEKQFKIINNSSYDYLFKIIYRYEKGESAGLLTSYYLNGNISISNKADKEIWSKDISTIKAVGRSSQQTKAKAFESFKHYLKVKYFKQALDILKQNKL